MSPTPADWVRLQGVIARKISELVDVFQRENTPEENVSVLSTSFFLSQREAAKKLVSAISDFCFQFLAEHNRSRSADAQLFLLAIWDDEVKPRLRDALNVRFRIGSEAIELMQRWAYSSWREPAADIAFAKKSKVDQIIDELGVSRGGRGLLEQKDVEYGFWGQKVLSMHSLTMQINTATSPEAQLNSPAVCHIPEAGTQRNRGGRPRKDHERARVRQLRKEGKTWGQVKQILDQELKQDKKVDAYRRLVQDSGDENP